MPKKHKSLTDYKNFWLIWLNCAGSQNGISLFKIQKDWNIETNYLYHKESGLGKPLFKAMEEEGYIKKEGKNIKANFGWITEYMIRRHKLTAEGTWAPGIFVIEKWGMVQKFIEKNANVFFDENLIRNLYENKIDVIKNRGEHIFDDIFLFMFILSIAPLCTKYHAENVIRVAYTVIGLDSKAEMLVYFSKLKGRLKNTKDVPVIVENEEEFLRILSPVV